MRVDKLVLGMGILNLATAIITAEEGNLMLLINLIFGITLIPLSIKNE